MCVCRAWSEMHLRRPVSLQQLHIDAEWRSRRCVLQLWYWVTTLVSVACNKQRRVNVPSWCWQPPAPQGFMHAVGVSDPPLADCLFNLTDLSMGAFQHSVVCMGVSEASLH